MCESILPALALCEGNLEGGPRLAEGWKMHPENGVLRSPNSAGPVFEHSLEQPLSSRKTPVPSPAFSQFEGDTVRHRCPSLWCLGWARGRDGLGSQEEQGALSEGQRGRPQEVDLET